ncbi:MAG TPA: ATP-binding cassette domain-containing protein [Ktedonobacteraceae bacterium]|nr:ATP-binding cassette domain-containing protein [Ktedonobacteraceae bacterium]
MAEDQAITIHNLSKRYRVAERGAGIRAALRSIVRRTMREVVAVKTISFEIAPGEVVGFLGPNGAGKTTTLKMLAGLLYPSQGEAHVLGHTPWRREAAYLRQIAMVMGQRSQLEWDLPALDSFELNQAIYEIPPAEYRRTLDELTDLLDLADLLKKPVRTLSLGERMKCEMAAALLHRPRVLFLDEPTIGLDLTSQRRIRGFLAEYNRRHGACILLTSHYMADVEALCPRVILIHQGELLFDGDLRELTRRFAAERLITVQFGEEHPDLSTYGTLIASSEGQVTLQVRRAEASALAQRLLAEPGISDLTIADPPLEQVIEQAFAMEARQ